MGGAFEGRDGRLRKRDTAVRRERRWDEGGSSALSSGLTNLPQFDKL